MTHFDWDPEKEAKNIQKHGIRFEKAAYVFKDPHRKIFHDDKHSEQEDRYLCIGKVDGVILTVRFTYRSNTIRIIGAGSWRKGRDYYEKD
ncbi:MAG: BrnT family toxin [Candidatus Omnitrophica bacterium]|nr:BrnT family toxin [Candidatus Omnitrophota bacterium]